MFQKSIEAIIAQGVKELEGLSVQAAQKAVEAKAAVSRCQSEIQSLVNLAKQVPEKVFDRYSQVLVSTIQIESYSSFCADIMLNGYASNLRGIMGDEKVKAGKYRVIVLLEPIS
jgi:hypothetical protein